jgi:hypothetical protein
LFSVCFRSPHWNWVFNVLHLSLTPRCYVTPLHSAAIIGMGVIGASRMTTARLKNGAMEK